MKTEKEKMLAGELYFAGDPELAADRNRAKDLCFRLNQTRPSESMTREAILAELLGTWQGDAEILSPFYCDYGYNIHLQGRHFFANHNLVILDCAEVTFGEGVLIGPNCGFYTAGHPLDAERRAQGEEYAKPIRVGNNVWFGGGVQVMPGVEIGDNCVIGAGSVVTHSIPANSLAMGSPCRVVRSLD